MNLKPTLLSIVIASVSTGVFADLNLDANLELDTTAIDTKLTSTEYKQGGRVEINATAREEMDQYFVAAKGTIKLATAGASEIGDAYVQLGTDMWDIQAGRFEAANLFPLGKDVVVEHANGTVYSASYVRGRFGDSDSGQFALHLNATDNLKFELGTAFGDFEGESDKTTAFSGVRPVVTFSSELASVSVGYEKVKYDTSSAGEVDKSGFGATVNFNVSGADINLNAAQSKDNESKDKVNSYAANVTYSAFGAGFIYSKEDDKADAGNDTSVKTTYLAYTMPLFGIDNASATLAGSYSSASDVDVDTNDKTTALRLRINYTF